MSQLAFFTANGTRTYQPLAVVLLGASITRAQLFRLLMLLQVISNEEPGVPFMAPLLKDLLQIHELQKLKREDGTYNFNHTVLCGRSLFAVESLRRNGYPFLCREDLLKYCQVNCSVAHCKGRCCSLLAC